MKRSDRTLVLHIETGGLTEEEEDNLVSAIMRVVSKHSVRQAHVESPFRLEG